LNHVFCLFPCMVKTLFTAIVSVIIIHLTGYLIQIILIILRRSWAFNIFPICIPTNILRLVIKSIMTVSVLTLRKLDGIGLMKTIYAKRSPIIYCCEQRFIFSNHLIRRHISVTVQFVSILIHLQVVFIQFILTQIS